MPDLKLESEIKRIFKESRSNYGTRKIQAKLKEIGITTSRRKIGEIMAKGTFSLQFDICVSDINL